MFSRLTTVIKTKMNTLLDRVEDPRQTLEYSHQKQQELLRNVKRGIAEVVSSKKRIQLHQSKLVNQLNKLDEQAKQAISIDRDDLAKSVLERKLVLQQQIEDIGVEIAELEQEQEKLIAKEIKLSSDLERFKTHKEVVKAQYSAAEAQVKISEASTGISDEIADVGAALERARDKTDGMRARAAALDEISNEGVLEDIMDNKDHIQRELDNASNTQQVEEELSKLKEEMKK
ncbi:MAG: PspA/IM30 family protein [Firmicutes bacterium]|nr:PspA/IM30 family protein [Bacillota bacterium]